MCQCRNYDVAFHWFPTQLLATVTSLLHHVQLQKAEKSEADEADDEPAVVQSAQVFAPKSLVLVSRLDYTEVFRVRR